MGRSLWRSKHRFIVLIAAACILAMIVIASGCLINKLGGNFKHEPEEIDSRMSDEAKALVDKAYSGIDLSKLFDYHTHIIGNGDSGSGCFVNKHMLSWYHPYTRFRFLVFASASGIENLETKVDRQYVERLVRLAKSIKGHGRYLVLAMDKHYTEKGKPSPSRTEYYVPNEYAVLIARKYPDLFVPGVSVHPYRPDALAKLDKWARQGLRFVKWIPNAMGIDPSDRRCVPFYETMRKNDMVLLTHTGHEKAIEAEEDQRFGNPLLFRKALDMGVKVIMAHAASLGENADLDDPRKKSVHNFELLMRLMDDERYEGRLFVDISAITQFNRLSKPVMTLLKRVDLHHRLVKSCLPQKAYFPNDY